MHRSDSRAVCSAEKNGFCASCNGSHELQLPIHTKVEQWAYVAQIGHLSLNPILPLSLLTMPPTMSMAV